MWANLDKDSMILGFVWAGIGLGWCLWFRLTRRELVFSS